MRERYSYTSALRFRTSSLSSGSWRANTLHAILSQPVQRIFEKIVILRPLELVKVQVAAIAIDVVCVDAVVVVPEGALSNYVFKPRSELLRQIYTREVI